MNPRLYIEGMVALGLFLMGAAIWIQVMAR